MFEATSAPAIDGRSRDDREYDGFLARLQARFVANLASGPLFTTDAEGLFDAYLDAMPSDRQYHNCHACRRFLESYGGLVTIDAEGRTHSALWHEHDAPLFYKAAIFAVNRLAKRAKVTGVFLSKLPVWGQPVTGEWHHLAVTPPESTVYRGQLLTAGQAMAEKKQDFLTVIRAIETFTVPMLETAMRVLNSESLYRAEKVIGPAKWLHGLRVAVDGARGPARNNLIWRAVATAPAGFCHPRSSMVGTLLEDIEAGMDFEAVSARFAAKMHPLQYQRPQAAPTAGNIAQAEKLVEQLGIRPSLARRYARLEDIEAIWTPKPKAAPPVGNGVFSHLKPKGETTTPQLIVPPTTMTWEKFARTVLPDAESIEFFVSPMRGPYVALVTAVNADAPPILQWDRPERRNPVSWYLYNQGSTPEEWGLSARQWCPVDAVTLKPSMWGEGGFYHHGNAAILILRGAKDSRNTSAALFPEILKSDLRAIRATIEAYSRGAVLEGAAEQSANGYMIAQGSPSDAMVRVHAGKTHADYRIDRWV